MLTDKLRLALQWRDDVKTNDMIESKNYRRTYLGFDSISQKELNAICAAANEFYSMMGSDLRITDSMGELIPYRAIK